MYYRSHIAHFKMVKVKVILLFPLGNFFYRQQHTKCTHTPSQVQKNTLNLRLNYLGLKRNTGQMRILFGLFYTRFQRFSCWLEVVGARGRGGFFLIEPEASHFLSDLSRYTRPLLCSTTGDSKPTKRLDERGIIHLQKSGVNTDLSQVMMKVKVSIRTDFHLACLTFYQNILPPNWLFDRKGRVFVFQSGDGLYI